MFDFLRNLTKSAEEKRQETVAAYLDEALSSRARRQFEQEMAQDETLRQEVAQLRLIKQSLRQLPQREVPRNFILNPAKYGRPVRQPWVQAYPILRAATAMTAFFLIFAFAVSIFTNSAEGGLATSAPVADVTQVEATEATAAESLAFEAEADRGTAVEAEEPAGAEAPADEVMTEETVAEEAVTAEEAQPAPAATAVPPLVTESLQEETTEDGATATEPLVAPTPTPSPVPTISPTPTVSTLPRVTPPTPLPERDLEQLQGDNTANSVVASVPEATAVTPEGTVQNLGGESTQPFNPMLLLQIGLGVLLLVLAGLTFYARRQR